jgi:hypothetical protein
LAVSGAVVAFAGLGYRLIPADPVSDSLFQPLGDGADTEYMRRLAGLTGDVRTIAGGRRAALALGDRTADGDSAGFLLAPFLVPPPGGTRFSGGALGAWCGSVDLGTAVVEAFYHHTCRLRASAGGFPAVIRMQAVSARIGADLWDLRAMEESRPELFHPTGYQASQRFGQELRAAGTAGILYPSLRRRGGENVVVFRPQLLTEAAPGDLFEFRWDSAGRPHVLKLTRFC